MQRRPYIPSRGDDERVNDPQVVPEIHFHRTVKTEIGHRLTDYVQKHTVQDPCKWQCKHYTDYYKYFSYRYDTKKDPDRLGRIKPTSFRRGSCWSG